MRGRSLPWRGQFDQLAHVVAADLGLVLGDAAEADADHLEALDQQVVRARGRGAAAEKAQHKDAAAPAQAPQRLVGHAGADRVIDDIDAVARTGQFLDLVAEPAAIVDREIGALLQTGGAFFLGAGGRDHGRAEQFRHLDRGDADAAGGAVDQHPVARLHPAALQQRVIGRVMRAAEHGGLLEAHARRARGRNPRRGNCRIAQRRRAGGGS